MARIRICGVCWKPLKECLCEDDATGPGEPQDGSDEKDGVTARLAP